MKYWGMWRMAPTDIDYYRRRAAQEREASGLASKQNVTEVHLELARAYEALLENAEMRPALRLVGLGNAHVCFRPIAADITIRQVHPAFRA